MPSIQTIKQKKLELVGRYTEADDGVALVEILTTLIPMGLLWWAAVWSVNLSYWLTAALALVLALFSLRVLVLMHECGHGSLFRSQRYNRGVGFLLGVLSGMPQYVWSRNHSYHHANNGNWEKFRGPMTSPSVKEYAAWPVSKQRAYRYARSPVLAPLGGFIYLIFNPRFTWIKGNIGMMAHIVKTKLAEPKTPIKALVSGYKSRYWKSSREYRHMSWNNLVVLSLWAAMSWAVGPGVFFAIYVGSVSLAGGAGIALFTVQHNFEHSYATDSARWDYDVGAIEGTSFLILPAWLNWFTANIAYHHVHHLSSRIPSYRLADCHNEYEDLFSDITRVKLSKIPASLKCLLWDQDAQRVISFAEYHQKYESSAQPHA